MKNNSFLVMIDTFHSPELRYCMLCIMNTTKEWDNYNKRLNKHLLSKAAGLSKYDDSEPTLPNLSSWGLKKRFSGQYVKIFNVAVSADLADWFEKECRSNNQAMLEMVVDKGEEVNL